MLRKFFIIRPFDFLLITWIITIHEKHNNRGLIRKLETQVSSVQTEPVVNILINEFAGL